jgi:capsule polysaccharide export protein KpsE/RkpR
VSDPLLILRRRWPVLLGFVAAGLCAGTIYYVYAPRRYEARLTVVPAQQRTALPPNLAQNAEMLSAIGVELGGRATSGFRIAAVLQSRAVTDAVIAKLDLGRRYGIEHPEKIRERLWSRCDTSVDRRSELVSVTCEDESADVARDIVHELGVFGNQAFQRVSASTASEERKFLETQVAEARKLADDVAKRLDEFQQAHAVVDLGEQAKTVVSMISDLERERISKQLELAYVTTFASLHESSAQQLQQRLALIDKTLQQLIEVPSSPAKSTNLFPSALEIPRLGFDLAQLLREQKVREAIYMALMQRLELAKADEVREASVFQILDEPVVATMKVWPRWHVIPIGAVAGFMLGLLVLLVPPWWRGLATRAASEQA